MFVRLFRWLLMAIAAPLCLVAVAWFGLAAYTHLGPRDGGTGTQAALYYASPWAAVALVSIGALGLALALRWRRVVRVIGPICALSTLLWWPVHWGSRPEPPEGTTPIRIFHWTADHYDSISVSAAAAKLAELDADVLCLREGVADIGAQGRAFPPLFPDYHIHYLANGLYLLVRGEIIACYHARFDRYRGRANILHLKVHDQEFYLVCYDQVSTPDELRAPALAALTRYIEKLGTGPVILMGDFNTPADSDLLDPLQDLLTDAFEQAGRGPRETWPMPVPVLSLDQAYVGSAVDLYSCRLLRTGWIGHRAIVLDLSIAPGTSPLGPVPKGTWPQHLPKPKT